MKKTSQKLMLLRMFKENGGKLKLGDILRKAFIANYTGRISDLRKMAIGS